jgi:hypothetical protein
MARNRWLRVRRLLPAAEVDVEFSADVAPVAAVDADRGDDETDADDDAEAALCRLRTILLLLWLLLPVVVAVLAVVVLPRLLAVVRLLAEDGLPLPVVFRCGDDDVIAVDVDVDADGKDKDGD